MSLIENYHNLDIKIKKHNCCVYCSCCFSMIKNDGKKSVIKNKCVFDTDFFVYMEVKF